MPETASMTVELHTENEEHLDDERVDDGCVYDGRVDDDIHIEGNER